MPSYFVCAIKFALQLGHDLFCNRHGFCSQLVGLVAISPSKLGHSTLKVVSLHRGSERKTRTKNRNIMIKCKKRMWTTFQSERTLSVCVSLWGFTSTSWAKHSFALSRTCNFFSLIGELLWRNTPIPINSSRNQIRHTNQPFSKSTQHCWYAQRERVFGMAEKEWKKWNEKKMPVTHAFGLAERRIIQRTETNKFWINYSFRKIYGTHAIFQSNKTEQRAYLCLHVS